MRILASLFIAAGGVAMVLLAIKLAKQRDERLAWAQGQTFMSPSWILKQHAKEIENEQA